MNKIEKLLLRGAGYGVLFMIIYFALAAVLGFSGVYVTAGRFFLVMLFAYVLAMAEFIFDSIERLNIWIKRLCVYVISLLAFLFIFVIGGGLSESAAAVFAALIIFTVVYAVGLGVILLIKRTLLADGSSKKGAKGQKGKKTKDGKKPYKSLYEE